MYLKRLSKNTKKRKRKRKKKSRVGSRERVPVDWILPRLLTTYKAGSGHREDIVLNLGVRDPGGTLAIVDPGRHCYSKVRKTN